MLVRHVVGWAASSFYSPMALENCVVSCAVLWEGESLRSLVHALGGRYSEVLDSHVTHVVTSRTNTHRYSVAKESYPETPVVHPRWLWACYWNNASAPVEPYQVDFYTAALRTGTYTARGTRALFYQELPLFHRVEDRVLSRGIRGNCLRNVMRQPNFAAESPHWPFVCRTLQHTVFWGQVVRDMNWARRCPLLMCLLQAKEAAAPRRRMRCCRDGPVPVLRHLTQLPLELVALVVQYC